MSDKLQFVVPDAVTIKPFSKVPVCKNSPDKLKFIGHSMVFYVSFAYAERGATYYASSSV